MWCAPINTINSITSIDLDNMVAKPTVGHQSTHGGYCGSAVKPIALNMVAEIARDPATTGLPISGIGGIGTFLFLLLFFLLLFLFHFLFLRLLVFLFCFCSVSFPLRFLK